MGNKNREVIKPAGQVLKQANGKPNYMSFAHDLKAHTRCKAVKNTAMGQSTHTFILSDFHGGSLS